jgi:hypothetical protein
MMFVLRHRHAAKRFTWLVKSTVLALLALNAGAKAAESSPPVFKRFPTASATSLVFVARSDVASGADRRNGDAPDYRENAAGHAAFFTGRALDCL